MSTEIISDIHLSLEDLEDPDWLMDSISPEGQTKLPILAFRAPLSSFDRIKRSLCNLRAANAPALLFLERPDNPPSLEELSQVLDFLKIWDQLTLHNLLQITYAWIPAKYSAALAQEAKVEVKWFREWLTASHDARISKYPGLPWRSYMRKIVLENYDFAATLLKLRQPSAEQPVDQLVQSFLTSKKKTVCLFPKKWSRMQ
jgi:hypothetical protein